MKRLGQWKTAVLCLLAICMVGNFVPYFAAPNFRYTGSDPSKHVWNFGFPLATVIYDPRNGWHEGPVAFVLLPVQAVGLVVLGTVAVVVDSKRNRARASAGADRSIERPNYRAMTTNERLFVAGLHKRFERAAHARDREKMIALLTQVEFSPAEAEGIVSKILESPATYGF